MSDDDTRGRIYEGWEEVERIVRTHIPRGVVAYVRLVDRSRQRDDTIGRFDILEERAGPTPLGFELDAAPVPDGPGANHVWTNGGPAEAVEAALNWLRRIMNNHTIGEPMKRFQVRLMGPKGTTSVDTSTCIVRNPEEENRPLDPVLPNLEQSNGKPRGAIGDAFLELAVSYQEMIRLAPAGISFVFAQFKSVIDYLEKRLEKEQRLNHELSIKITEMNDRVRRLDASTDAETTRVRAQSEVARTAMQELATSARFVFAARSGLPPELLALTATIDANPKLKQTLANPKVHELLQDSANVDVLVTLLEAGVAQADAAKAAMETPPAAP